MIFKSANKKFAFNRCKWLIVFGRLVFNAEFSCKKITPFAHSVYGLRWIACTWHFLSWDELKNPLLFFFYWIWLFWQWNKCKLFGSITMVFFHPSTYCIWRITILISPFRCITAFIFTFVFVHRSNARTDTPRRVLQKSECNNRLRKFFKTLMPLVC